MGVTTDGSVAPNTTDVTGTINGESQTWTGLDLSTDNKPVFTLSDSTSGNAFQFTESYRGPVGIKRDHDPKKYRVNKRNHKYLSVLSVILLSPAQVLANAVSQSNNGSVTNMAVQTLTGNMTTNQYGGNIVCQGPTYPLAHSPLLEQITSSLIGTIMKRPFTIQQMQMMMVCQITQVMCFSIRKIILERIKIVML